jgi:uncharacterized caspase-like protein
MSAIDGEVNERKTRAKQAKCSLNVVFMMIFTAQDVAVEALRVSDYTKRLAGLPLKASLIVLDAARDTPFAKSGPPLAGGLALADAEPNMLVAFNATPGTVAPTESGPYGAYARALTEMIREGGLPAPDVFDGVRLRETKRPQGLLCLGTHRGSRRPSSFSCGRRTRRLQP